MGRLWTAVLGAIALFPAQAQDLCQAASLGDLAKVQNALAHGAKPDTPNADGETALLCAVALTGRAGPRDRDAPASDYAGVVKLLLDKGANSNARDKSGRTPLIRAMEGSASEYRVIGANEPAVRLLVERGAAVNAQDNQGWSPLLKLVSQWADQPELLEFMIAKGADVNTRTKDGISGLTLAARLGKTDRVSMLLDHRANINAQDNQGRTVLMEAVTSQRKEGAEIARVLLQRGANIDAVTRAGKSAADLAVAAGFPDRAQLLFDNGARVKDRVAALAEARNHALLRVLTSPGEPSAAELLAQGADPNVRDTEGRTALMVALAEGIGVEGIALFLDKGGNVNAVDPAGSTPLMIAADRFDAAIVKLLLDRGADTRARDREGNTPLLRAAASKRSYDEKQEALIPALLEKGADPNAKNSQGVTALMLTAREGNSALLDLLDKGAEVDARDRAGNTALLYAAGFFVRQGERLAGVALLEAKADVNATNQDGETALMRAATQYEAAAAKLLLDTGAEINARDRKGRTALMRSIDGPEEFDNTNHLVYSPAIAEFLIARGADVNARAVDGDTPLKIASRRGYVKMVKLLRDHGAKE